MECPASQASLVPINIAASGKEDPLRSSRTPLRLVTASAAAACMATLIPASYAHPKADVPRAPLIEYELELVAMRAVTTPDARTWKTLDAATRDLSKRSSATVSGRVLLRVSPLEEASVGGGALSTDVVIRHTAPGGKHERVTVAIDAHVKDGDAQLHLKSRPTLSSDAVHLIGASDTGPEGTLLLLARIRRVE